jgi:cytochrome c
MRFLIATIALTLITACGDGDTGRDAPSAPQGAEAPAEEVRPSAAELQAQVAALAAPYNAADYEAGRRAFAQCRSCHVIEAGARNRVGPNLHGIFGREIGSVEDFTYSQPVQDANFTWTPEQLDHWLENPQTFLPGNRMAFAGVRDATQRRDLIAYLMVESAAE